MNERIKAKWIEALRSGEYRQGKDVLREGDAFCCLGVLCNLHAQEHPEIAATQRRADLYLDCATALPEPVRKWAGALAYEGPCGTSALAHMNDSGVSFAYIANVIEKYL